MNQSIIRQQELTKASLLFSTGLSLILLFLYSGNVHFWQISNPVFSVPFLLGILPAFVLLIWSAYVVDFKLSRLNLDPRLFALTLFLLFFLDWMTRGYSFIDASSFRSFIFWTFLISFIFFSKLTAEKFIFYSLVSVTFGLFLFYFKSSDGLPIFSDDHPVFLYRLQLLKEHFPNIPVYTTEWAAGRDTLHLFATGTLNVFLLFFIPIYLFPLEIVYSGIVFAIIFLVNPWSSYFAARLWGYSKRVAALTGLISLSSNAIFYQWGLKYGTLGFLTSVSLLPLVISLLFLGFLGLRPKDKAQDISFKNSILLVYFTSLALAWSSIALAFIPIIIYGLLSFKVQIKKKNLVLSCFVISLLTLPWMVFFWKEWSVNSFLTRDKHVSSSEVVHEQEFQKKTSRPVQFQVDSSKKDLNNIGKPAEDDSPLRAFRNTKAEFNFSKSLLISKDNFIRFNVLILFLTIPGLSIIRPHFKKLYSSILFFCLILGLFISPRFPQLELERMLIVLAQLSALPAALSIEVFFSRRDLFARKFFAATCFAYLVAGILASMLIFSNKSYDKYNFAGNELKEVREVIKSYNYIPGRLLFSGFVLHHLDSGHVAVLPKLTNRPMLASSHLHNLWRYTQIFPKEVLAAGDSGIREYLKLYNVGIVAAHEDYWKDYFSKRKSQFKYLGIAGKFSFFQTPFLGNNYFLEGSGEITNADSSGLKLKIFGEEAVIKFKYLKHLKSNCKLNPRKTKFGDLFIHLSSCQNKDNIFISSKSFFERLF